jgi:hypothetical protein
VSPLRASAATFCLICAVGLGDSAARAQDPVATAEAAAKAFGETTGGRAYEESVGKAFGRDHRETVSSCVKVTQRPDLSNFALLLRVGADGAVAEALASPATNVSDCVRTRMQGWRPGVPPRADSWVKLGVALKRK